MSLTTFIYILKDPVTGEIRYVGKTNDPEKRFLNHLSDREINHRTNWIKSLLKREVTPAIEIIDEVLDEHWQQWEVAWIEYFREQGCPLLNGTPGGDGPPCGENHPNFGKRQSPELVEKRVAPLRGRKMTAEQKLKISITNTGKKRTPEQCKNISMSLMGRKLSEKQRLKAIANLRPRKKKI